MRIGKAGLDLIQEFEGLRLEAYKDSVGVWTIGWGHTAAAGPPKPAKGMTITAGQAEAILISDLGQYEAAVSQALTKTPNQNQFDAMVSLCFNVGPGNFKKSSVAKLFNAGDPVGAADAFLKWNKADGKVLNGLTRRRGVERQLFLLPVGAAEPAVVETPPVTPAGPPKPAYKPSIQLIMGLLAAAGAVLAAIFGLK